MSNILSQLHNLLRKDSKWRWGKERNEFRTLKQSQQSLNLLVHYDPEKKVIIECDTSPAGVGAVLSLIFDGV